MKNTIKFIKHICTSFQKLNEAINQKDLNRFINKFKQEAEDFSIEISDDELKKAIEIFDSRFKNNPNIEDKDLNNYSLTDLLRLVKSKPGMEDDIEITPDVVYNENGVIIYNGDTEGKCILYGKGEKWCITRGSFASYRYDSERKFPTFYLVKDTNLDNSNPKSFFVIVVGSDNTYKASDRTNNDVGGTQTEWNVWRDWDFIEKQFPSIRGLQRIFKYIPSSEKVREQEDEYKRGLSFNEWSTELNFEQKKQYLVVRYNLDKQLFTNITDDYFINKILPKYDKLMEWVVQSPWIIGLSKLLIYYDLFKPKFQNSLISKINNPGNPFKISYSDIQKQFYPFEVIYDAVKNNKIEEENTFYYLKDNIVVIINSRNSSYYKVSLLTKNDFFQNINLNKRTEKYLFDYPNIEKLDFIILLNTIKTNDLDTSIIGKLIEKIETNEEPDNNKIIINKEGSKILHIIDYQKGRNNLIVLDISTKKITNLSGILFKEDLINEIIKRSTLCKQLIKNIGYHINNGFLEEEDIIRIIEANPTIPLVYEKFYLTIHENKLYGFDKYLSEAYYKFVRRSSGNIFVLVGFNEEDTNIPKIHIDSLNKNNFKNNKNDLMEFFDEYTIPYIIKEKYAELNIPYSEDNDFVVDIIDDNIYLINSENTSESLKVDKEANRLKKASTKSRGRPAGSRNYSNTGNMEFDQSFIHLLDIKGIRAAFNSLPNGVRARFTNAELEMREVNYDRGASRRQNILGGAGRVTEVFSVGRSSLYFIRLNNGNIITSLVSQPGNQHYILYGDRAYNIDSPSDLYSALRHNALLELKTYFKQKLLSIKN